MSPRARREGGLRVTKPLLAPLAQLARVALVAMVGMMAMLAAGCGGLHSEQPAPQTYLLGRPGPPAGPAGEAGAAAATPLVTGGATVQVLRPLAAPGLDTDQIALQRDGQRLDYYAASRWPAPLPDLVQALAMDALRASGRFRAVQPDATAFAADEVLQIEIRHCEVAYAADGTPAVHVQLLATLGHQADRALLATVTAESSQPAAANRMQSVVAAFQQAVDAALAQLAARLAPPVQP